MIERERLKGLIEQKAKIYSTHWQEEVDLSLPCEIVESEYDNKTITRLVVFEDEEHTPSYMLDNLTEDIEGAKWEEEFGCIERTERLELPTWEEIFPNKNIVYNGIYDCWWEKPLYYGIEIVAYITDGDYENGFIRVNGTYFKGITKENYTLACRKCKELFLGE